MKKLLIIFILISVQINAKIYSIEDLKLEKPQAKNLSDRVVYTLIYGGDFNKQKREIKKALEKDQINSLLHYQLINLIQRDNNFDPDYYIDEDLKLFKLIILNSNNGAELKQLIAKKENNKYISDLIITHCFNNNMSLFNKSIFKLNPSSNLDVLLIKINYEKHNYDFLEKSLNKLNKQNKLLVLDLLIKEYSNSKEAFKSLAFMIQRNDLSYDLSYSEKLINFYTNQADKESLELELKKFLEVKKDFALLNKLLLINATELEQEDFDKYNKYVELVQLNELRLNFIELLHQNGKPWDKLILDLKKDHKNVQSWIFYKAVHLVVEKKEKEALEFIKKGALKKDKRLTLLESKLKILNEVEIINELDPYFTLSKEISNRIFLVQDYKTDYLFKTDLAKTDYELIDFYRDYDAIDSRNKLSLIKCFITYKNLYPKLSDEDKELIKSKMEALSFE